jgi:acyl-CoA synthetase (AMP-forming)/AMP-acid ligase II
MTHAAGPISLILMSIGSTNIVLPTFKPEWVMEAVQKHKVTFFFLPPTAIYMLMAHPDVRKCDWSSVEQFTYAAAPMSVAKLREAREIFGPIMASGFGQVEAPATCTIFPAWEHRDGPDGNLGSCGRPAVFTKLGIIDDDGNLLGDGERGEIVVRGDLVMAGYYKNPEATADVSGFGWHHTGDVGYRDNNGYYYIVDRKKDMIITGGFNVYPTEVEQVVLSHPAVQDCAVVGAPDEKWGEAVTAVCELKAGATVSAEEIIALCKERLGSVKAPKSVRFESPLPRSAAGKVLKRAIRDKLWEGQTRRI